MRRIITILALLLPLTVWAGYDPAFGDDIDRSADDFVTVSLCVAEPTNWRDDVLGVYGHAFLRLQCPIFDLDYCYSYEGEHVNGQMLKYLCGKLKMGMFAIPTQEYVEDYRRWDRAVHEYVLALPPEVDQKLWEIMDNHVLEGTDLALDLKERGCSSSAADYVTRALKPHYSIKYTDKPSNTDFAVPARLAEIWQNATLDGKPFAVYVGDLVEAEPATLWSTWYDTTALVVILVVLAALVVVLRRRRNH